MYDISTLITPEGTVLLGGRMFPRHITVGLRNGVSPAKFYLVRSPEDENSWIALAWVSNPTGAAPIPILGGEIDKIYKYTPQLTLLTLRNGESVTIENNGGCGCGSRMPDWRPWDAGVQEILLPVSSVPIAPMP